ncbi:MAG: ABC transporter permease subunit, partial [Pseudomonadota bacterium]|nr:ABC transporter permease subunit [Pseudomonadota bacterium]
PKIAFLPVFMLWLGPSFASKMLIVAVSVVFPVITAAAAGTEAVDKTMLWSAQSLGATKTSLLWQVNLPAAIPQIITGLQIGLPFALITTVVAEMLMGSDGLGGAMLASMRFADSPGVFSGILAIGVLGFGLIRALELLRRRLLAWHAEAGAH